MTDPYPELTVEAERLAADERCVQHSEHPVSGVDAAAVVIQEREDVFV